MSREQKKIYRADLFRHLDGIVTAPTAYALYKKGVLDFILSEKKVSLAALTKTFKANEGYLNVALHTLASQGWLEHVIKGENDIEVSITTLGKIAFQYIPKYKDVVELLQLSGKYHSRKFEVKPFHFLEQIVEKYKEKYGLEASKEKEEQQVQLQILKQYRRHHCWTNSCCSWDEWYVS